MYQEAAEIIKKAKRVTAFTGAGISVESGIPPFRGKNGLWTKYDPGLLDIHYFLNHPKEAWQLIKEIFYDFFGKARPNAAHYALFEMEQKGWLDAIITQNIDHLHQDAGSRNVYEFHGTSRYLKCLKCRRRFPVAEVDWVQMPPVCRHCGGLLKPDFVFFGEAIPEPAHTQSFLEAEKSDVFLVIGTTGEVTPACLIPRMAWQNHAKIIEVNTLESAYTNDITDIFLQGTATQVMKKLLETMNK